MRRLIVSALVLLVFTKCSQNYNVIEAAGKKMKTSVSLPATLQNVETTTVSAWSDNVERIPENDFPDMKFSWDTKMLF